MLVSILRQGSYLIASIHEALNDREIVQFQRDLVEQIGTHRARGVIIDVAALDVLDSFGSRTLLNLAHAARLRGAETVIVGIQPSVAFALVRLGMGLDNVHTALDLEEGLAYLQRLLQEDHGSSRPSDDCGRSAGCFVTGDAYERFRRDYAPVFLQYLSERGEPGRRAAYELGRRAIVEQLSVLDLARIHHGMLLDVLKTHQAPRSWSTSPRPHPTSSLRPWPSSR